MSRVRIATCLALVLMLCACVSKTEISLSISPETETALLSGDWDKLEGLTSDWLATQDPIKRFLHTQSCKLTNNSYYPIFGSWRYGSNTGISFDSRKAAFNWLSDLHTRFNGNANVTYFLAMAGKSSLQLTWEETKSLLTHAIAQDSTLATAYADRALINAFLLELGSARSDIESAFLLGDSLCYVHLINAMGERESPERALQLLRPCLELNPRHALALSDEASWLLKLGKPQAAINSLKLAVEQEPWSMDLLWLLAYNYELTLDSVNSLDCYKRILESTTPLFQLVRDLAVQKVNAMDK